MDVACGRRAAGGTLAAPMDRARASAGAAPSGAGSEERTPDGGPAAQGGGTAGKRRGREGTDVAGGAAIKRRRLCPHDRQAHHCKECGGSSICPHQRIRSKCKECRAEADELIPDGLEELGQGVGAGQNRRTANPISTLSFPQDHVTHGRQV